MGRKQYTFDEAVDRLDSVAGTEYFELEVKEVLKRTLEKDKEAVADYARTRGWRG